MLLLCSLRSVSITVAIAVYLFDLLRAILGFYVCIPSWTLASFQ